MRLDTVIFDMDGLLVDSEPLWEEAGAETLLQYGKKLTTAQYLTSVGLRTREWLDYWFTVFSIPNTNIENAEEKILRLVTDKIKDKGRALPGVEYIFQYFVSRGFKIGLATSSPLALAEVVIAKLQIGQYLQTITSAENMPYGKPHPQIYLDCAAELGSKPINCLCFEDSFNGLIAAKAARMKCVAVPAYIGLQHARWGAADLKISSLQNFNDLLLMQLNG